MVADCGPHNKAQGHPASNGDIFGISLRDRSRNDDIRKEPIIKTMSWIRMFEDLSLQQAIVLDSNL